MKEYTLTTVEAHESHPHMEGKRRLVKVKCRGLDDMQVSDGYHTMDELYDHRITLYIALCRELRANPAYQVGQKANVWRSRVHADGSFMQNWFVLGIGTEEGEQIAYHLPESRWEECDFADTYEIAPIEWDGHTSADVLERLKAL